MVLTMLHHNKCCAIMIFTCHQVYRGTSLFSCPGLHAPPLCCCCTSLSSASRMRCRRTCSAVLPRPLYRLAQASRLSVKTCHHTARHMRHASEPLPSFGAPVEQVHFPFHQLKCFVVRADGAEHCARLHQRFQPSVGRQLAAQPFVHVCNLFRPAAPRVCRQMSHHNKFGTAVDDAHVRTTTPVHQQPA